MKKWLGRGASIFVAMLLVASPALADYSQTWGGNTISQTMFNDGTGVAQMRLATAFTTVGAGTISSVQYDACIGSNSPDGNFIVALQADSAGSPSGTDLATYSITGSSLPSTCGTFQTATLSSTVSLSATTQYWIVFRATGTPDLRLSYNVRGDTSGDASHHSKKYATSAGGVWTSLISSRILHASISVTEAPPPPPPPPPTPTTGSSTAWMPQASQLLGNVTSATVLTGTSVWGMLPFLGIPIAFIIAIWVMEFIKKSTRKTTRIYAIRTKDGDPDSKDEFKKRGSARLEETGGYFS